MITIRCRLFETSKLVQHTRGDIRELQSEPRHRKPRTAPGGNSERQPCDFFDIKTGRTRPRLARSVWRVWCRLISALHDAAFFTASDVSTWTTPGRQKNSIQERRPASGSLAAEQSYSFYGAVSSKRPILESFEDRRPYCTAVIGVPNWTTKSTGPR